MPRLIDILSQDEVRLLNLTGIPGICFLNVPTIAESRQALYRLFATIPGAVVSPDKQHPGNWPRNRKIRGQVFLIGSGDPVYVDPVVDWRQWLEWFVWANSYGQLAPVVEDDYKPRSLVFTRMIGGEEVEEVEEVDGNKPPPFSPEAVVARVRQEMAERAQRVASLARLQGFDNPLVGSPAIVEDQQAPRPRQTRQPGRNPLGAFTQPQASAPAPRRPRTPQNPLTPPGSSLEPRQGLQRLQLGDLVKTPRGRIGTITRIDGRYYYVGGLDSSYHEADLQRVQE